MHQCSTSSSWLPRCVVSVMYSVGFKQPQRTKQIEHPQKMEFLFLGGWIFIQGTQKVHGLSSLLASYSSRERQEKRWQRWRPCGPPGRLNLGIDMEREWKRWLICFGRCMEMCTYDLCISLLCRNLFIILTSVIYTIYVVFICYIYTYIYLHLHDCCTCIFCTCIHPRCILLMIWDYHGCPIEAFSSHFLYEIKITRCCVCCVCGLNLLLEGTLSLSREGGKRFRRVSSKIWTNRKIDPGPRGIEFLVVREAWKVMKAKPVSHYVVSFCLI